MCPSRGKSLSEIQWLLGLNTSWDGIKLQIILYMWIQHGFVAVGKQVKSITAWWLLSVEISIVTPHCRPNSLLCAVGLNRAWSCRHWTSHLLQEIQPCRSGLGWDGLAVKEPVDRSHFSSALSKWFLSPCDSSLKHFYSYTWEMRIRWLVCLQLMTFALKSYQQQHRYL